MKKRILITAGPIPGNLDAVKYITNRFKGGLTFKLVDRLANQSHGQYEVTVIKWKFTPMPSGFDIGSIRFIDIDNVNDYFDAVMSEEYDAYILSAAVANLVPKTPWIGKFPSHEYKVGDVIPVEFVIAPRVIDEVKKKYPKALLVGYKLFDGSEDELCAAGWHTLTDSKANVVFCNHPAWAKDRKIALLPDGTKLEMTFDEHVKFIDRMLNLKWYRTQINTNKTEIPQDEIKCIEKKLDFLISNNRKDAWSTGYDFGTVALRYNGGFIITTRGKKPGNHGRFTFVSNVDHATRTVYADDKASLNAPLIAKLFSMAPPSYDLVLHGHTQLPVEDNLEDNVFDYVFPGTTEENIAADSMSCNIKGHGFYMVSKCKR